jgi:hypothetical protein
MKENANNPTVKRGDKNGFINLVLEHKRTKIQLRSFLFAFLQENCCICTNFVL